VRAVGRLSDASLRADIREQLLAAFRGWKKP
jgi:hypothetical protein